MAYTTINKSGDYFNTKLYTGNGSYGHGITGVGFSPSLVWIKNRVDNADHRIFDAVRGTDKSLSSNNSNATVTGVNLLHSFDSDGFTIDDDGAINTNNNAICSWNWKANGAGSANTDGSISSTVSANTTSGFSIVKYAGTGSAGTVGHGLGAAAAVIMVKDLTGTENWQVYHSGLGATNRYLELNTNASYADGYAHFNGTAPTNSVFSLGNTTGTNGSGKNYIAYCFAEKTGYSKFGSYTGNGNADGTFIYTGFKPAFVMTKRTNITSHWLMMDNKRDTFNVADALLVANDSDSETNWGTGRNIDFLSNGFKCRSTSSGLNVSGSTYIYMAFAEAPLVGSNNVPCTAR